MVPLHIYKLYSCTVSTALAETDRFRVSYNCGHLHVFLCFFFVGVLSLWILITLKNLSVSKETTPVMLLGKIMVVVN